MVTSLYDQILAEEGVTITQYAVLVNVGRNAEGIQVSSLAALLGMERTTLTRNVQPLIRTKWLSLATGKDRRSRVLRLTPAGEQKVNACFPLWESAQKRFIEGIGVAHLRALRSELDAVAESLKESRID
jgi:DNA-binding MarR family transcriptional regulator